MKIRVKEIKSKSGISYRMEFNDKKQECTITCLSAVGACSFLKREIHHAMDSLKLEVLYDGFESITYKCPSYMYPKVTKRIQEC